MLFRDRTTGRAAAVTWYAHPSDRLPTTAAPRAKHIRDWPKAATFDRLTVPNLDRQRLMKSSKKASRQRPPDPPAKAETPAAEFLTIGWLLTVMTTVVCLAGHLVVKLLGNWQLGGAWVDVLAGILLFAAVVVGIGSIALLALVRKMRAESPPGPIMVFSLAVGLAPLLFVLAQAIP